MTEDERRRCTARSKRTGVRCGSTPPPGSDVCKWHGGKAPQALAKAEERRVEEAARATFRALFEGAEPVENPFDALAQVAGEVLAWKEFCAERIADLEVLRSRDDRGTEQINALVSLFERSMDRAVSTLAAISKLGIEERLARVTERQSEAVVRAVDAALAAAGLSGQRVAEGRAAAARELRRAA